VAEETLGCSCEKAVITVPANFNELQRTATRAAGMVAGLDVLRILNEPTAAAIAYGYGTDKAQRVAVYDLGGGTFDVTILEMDGDVFEVVATAGDTFLGGDDIDLILAEVMADAFFDEFGSEPREDQQVFERLKAAGEWAKCMLSSEESVDVQIPSLMADSKGQAQDLAFTMTREQLESKVGPLLDQSITVCEEALGLASLEPKDIDSVVLVGGSTRIPMARQKVSNFFGRPPRSDFDPDLVVALGAAIQGYALSSDRARRSIAQINKPAPARIEAVQRRKEAARAARPEQPAFAPLPPPSFMPPIPTSKPPQTIQAYRPPSPMGAIPVDGPGKLALSDLPEPAADAVATPTSNAADSEPPIFLESTPPEDAATESPDETGALPAVLAFASTPIGDVPAEVPPPLPAVLGDAPVPPPLPPVLGDGPTAPNLPPILADDPAPPGLPPVLDSPPGAAQASPPDLPMPDMDLEVDLAPPPLDEVGDIDLGILDVDVAPHAPAPSPDAAPDPIVELPPRAAPLLMDVTPHTLGIQTVGGYCERIIARNIPIPVEQVRVFTTALDNQETVQVSVCQGESRVFAENQELGEIEMTGLRSARRGEVRIEVAFMLDADGTLDVKATDIDTGRVQSTRIHLVGGYDPEELEAMKARQENTVSA